MDVEAALLENSPTLSTISSDCTDTTYSGPGSPYSPESPIIVKPSYKKTKDDEVTPRPTPRHPLPPRKPNLRIRPPYLMICISILEIAVHCLGDEATLRRWLVYDPRQRVQGWRFASYMLLHWNALHLALNVVIQLVLATPLEVEQGRIGVATIYLGGGVCGALGASLLQPSLFLMGASAGVYALLTSHLAHLYLIGSEKSVARRKIWIQRCPLSFDAGNIHSAWTRNLKSIVDSQDIASTESREEWLREKRFRSFKSARFISCFSVRAVFSSKYYKFDNFSYVDIKFTGYIFRSTL